ncbi:MAG: protoporphyrinogen oxidase HemJ [Hyphomicrobiales bacterium]|jgi:putative membrane protein|nr:protoporphyrinogen oxidase HemJ [Hyphomicrobiales bacterium]
MYEWIKALHVVAIISWMAALLYLPRLMIYHCAAELGSVQSETFKVMERRLLKAIMTPAMIVGWASGLYLAWRGNWLGAGWFQVKLMALIALSAAHGFLAGQVRVFAEDRNQRSARFFRIVNEVPTLLMLLIVAMVIVKPA